MLIEKIKIALFGKKNKYIGFDDQTLDSSFGKLINIINKYGHFIFNDDGVATLNKINQKAVDYSIPPFVMVVGVGNSGKSSLVNAILGENLAKVSAVPYTWKIDIYKYTQKRNFAEIVYEYNNHTYKNKCSFAKAWRIINKEDKRRKKIMLSKNDESWKSIIKSVWWNVSSNNILSNFCIVDTPGIDQLRVDAKAKLSNLDFANGIQIEREDSIDYYYYRSNIVLWCIDSSTIEAYDNLETLKRYKNDNKIIIGILTKIDRNNKYASKESIINYARQIYGDYIDDFCVSGCSDNAIRKETICNIINKINVLISKRMIFIKANDIFNFHDALLNNLAERFDKFSTMVSRNVDIISDCIESGTNIAKKYIVEIVPSLSSTIAKTVISSTIFDLYELYDSNENDFTDNVKKRIGTYLRANSDKISSMLSLMTKEINSIINQAKWNSVVLGNHECLSSISANNINGFALSMDHFDLSSIDISNNENITKKNNTANGIALAAGAVGLFALGPIGLAAGALGMLFQPTKDDKIKAMRESINNCQDMLTNSIANMINSAIGDVCKYIDNGLDTQFEAVNGMPRKSVKSFFNGLIADLSECRLLNS